MVKALTQDDRTAINAAIHEAEQATGATIRVVVLPASDRYQDFILLYGLILGSLVALVLWGFDIVSEFPWLLTVQFGVTALCDLLPPLRRFCLRLVPSHVAKHRAARMALQEFHAHHHLLPQERDFILLFVSLAERYVHILTNPALHKKLPEGWDAVTDNFIGAIRKEGLRVACIEAVKHSGLILMTARR